MFSTAIGINAVHAIHTKYNNVKVVHFGPIDSVRRTSIQKKIVRRQTYQQLETIPANTELGQAILNKNFLKQFMENRILV